MVDSVVINSETPEEDPKQAEEMIAKGEALEKGESPSSESSSEESNADRPEWLPEKFKSPEDMAKAYAELEKKQGKQADEEKAEGDNKDDTNESLEIDNDKVDEALEEKGLSMADMRSEFQEKGELSAETYEKLEKAGFSKDDVDNYIEGQKALAATVQQEGYSFVGGEENYKAMATWARENLSQAERTAFNEQINKAETREVAIRGLYAKFAASEGREPGRRVGGDANTNTGEVYESRAQMTADMRDPRYQNDPAFRKKVAEKLARSEIM